jgi:hypothetical protein
MVDAKWSDETYLRELSLQGDFLADRAVRELIEGHGVEKVSLLFQSMHAGEEGLPEGSPEPLRRFMAETSALPDGLDTARLERGGEVFLTHAFSAAVVLLASSLPAGYCAPRLSQILAISGDLDQHPYKRLMGVLQLLVNISTHRSFEPNGVAVLMAQKMRLLHAGIRTIVPKYKKSFQQDHGVPVSHVDMLATIMGFSYLVIDGLRKLGVDLSKQEEEDFYYLWRVFAQMVGIHPDGKPESDEYVPPDVDSAAAFYNAYAQRYYVPASENPEGVDLSRHNIGMIESLIPDWLKLFGFRALPKIVMLELLGRDGMAMTGIRPVTGHHFMKAAFSGTLRLVQKIEGDAPGHLAERLGQLVFQEMIDKSRGGEVTFLVPTTLADMRELA